MQNLYLHIYKHKIIYFVIAVDLAIKKLTVGVYVTFISVYFLCNKILKKH